MVGSRWVVQGCRNRSNKAAGGALHASPTDGTRDLWVWFVRIKRKSFCPQPQAQFVIYAMHFEDNCSTRTFDPTQRRQPKPDSLSSIWRKKKPSAERDSTGFNFFAVTVITFARTRRWRQTRHFFSEKRARQQRKMPMRVKKMTSRQKDNRPVARSRSSIPQAHWNVNSRWRTRKHNFSGPIFSSLWGKNLHISVKY